MINKNLLHHLWWTLIFREDSMKSFFDIAHFIRIRASGSFDEDYLFRTLIDLLYSSQLVEFTDSWRAELALTAESALLQQCTQQLSSSTWQLRFLSWPETLAKTSRWNASPQDTYSSQSEETRNLTLWSRLPSLVVVSSRTSTRPSSLSRPRRPSEQLISIRQVLSTTPQASTPCQVGGDVGRPDLMSLRLLSDMSLILIRNLSLLFVIKYVNSYKWLLCPKALKGWFWEI